MDKRINNGGARKGAGRKSKAAEQKLIENLTPMNDRKRIRKKRTMGGQIIL